MSVYIAILPRKWNGINRNCSPPAPFAPPPSLGVSEGAASTHLTCVLPHLLSSIHQSQSSRTLSSVHSSPDCCSANYVESSCTVQFPESALLCFRVSDLSCHFTCLFLPWPPLIPPCEFVRNKDPSTVHTVCVCSWVQSTSRDITIWPTWTQRTQTPSDKHWPTRDNEWVVMRRFSRRSWQPSRPLRGPPWIPVWSGPHSSHSSHHRHWSSYSLCLSSHAACGSFPPPGTTHSYTLTVCWGFGGLWAVSASVLASFLTTAISLQFR